MGTRIRWLEAICLIACVGLIGLYVVYSESISSGLFLDAAHLESDWPMFHQNLVHTGVSPDTVAVPLSRAWDFATGPCQCTPVVVESSPAASGGLVYFGAYDHNMYALDANTGNLVWRFQTDVAFVSSPAVVNDIVYIGNERNVYAFNAHTGAVAWTFATTPVADSFVSSPAVAAGVVYIGAEDNKFYALNATTGVPTGATRQTTMSILLLPSQLERFT